MAQDVVHYARERRGGVDWDAARRDFFPGYVQVFDQLPFRRLAAPFVRRPLVKAPTQRFNIRLQDEDGIEQVDEGGQVPGPAAEECRWFPLVCGQLPDVGHPPEVMAVQCGSGDPRNRFAGFRITLVGEVTFAAGGLLAAPPQFMAYSGLTGTGTALDKVILPAHA